MASDPLTTLATYAVCSAAVFLTTTFVSKRLLPLPEERLSFAASCVTALLNACLCPLAFMARAAFNAEPSASVLDCSPGAPNLLTTPTSDYAIIACGINCGFFIADTFMLVAFPKQMIKDLGGMHQYLIMWMHHTVSMVVWPYSVVAGRAGFFVIYFMVTEVTNMGSNAYYLCREFQLAVTNAIAGVWILGFFVVRILPVPYLLYAYVTMFLTGQDCGFSTAEMLVGRLTVPIPIMLNLFWFSLMYQKVKRMLKPSKKGAGGAKAEQPSKPPEPAKKTRKTQD